MDHAVSCADSAVSLLADHNLPFAIALMLMAAVFVIQLFGIFDVDLDLDTDVDGDAAISAGPVDGLLTLLGLGRIPLTIWIVAFLLAFAGIGVGIQELAQNLTGAPLDRLLAAVFAGGAALPVTSLIARPLGRVIPKDETTAVNIATLVGRRARITDGVAQHGSPARARVKDVHGQTHYVMVEPHEQSSQLHAGDDVLLVRRDDILFYATALADRRLSPTD